MLRSRSPPSIVRSKTHQGPGAGGEVSVLGTGRGKDDRTPMGWFPPGLCNPSAFYPLASSHPVRVSGCLPIVQPRYDSPLAAGGPCKSQRVKVSVSTIWVGLRRIDAPGCHVAIAHWWPVAAGLSWRRRCLPASPDARFSKTRSPEHLDVTAASGKPATRDLPARGKPNLENAHLSPKTSTPSPPPGQVRSRCEERSASRTRRSRRGARGGRKTR